MRQLLPVDHADAILLGRIETREGPTPIVLRDGEIEDLSRFAPTISDLIDRLAPGELPPRGRSLGAIDALVFRPDWEGGMETRLLSPIDLQCIKASGVTFAISAIERVIEERARGDALEADRIREDFQARLGGDIRAVKPGSESAMQLKALLIADGMWSQYLEVAIGKDAEIFTKAPVLSSVGAGADIGVRGDSEWNNPEPEVAIMCDPRGHARGATLANDVNLRDIEGRSALLLGKAKDNNASCALGPFIRLFDDRFTLDDIRRSVISLEIEGPDNFRLEGSSSMGMISRDPLDLIGQTIGASHQYPDGFVLLLGTMFAPIEDRSEAGRGFTHKRGDIVRIATPKLGALVNRVVACEDAPPWTVGIGALMRNLVSRGLIQ
ncbi:fumarylacetoacetate hydrolase family protein [Sphingomonas sp.]|uniref:fumarylacetoacetate hydrolase family protein n=1 Tax=Sphingomonas sp. TaxID=28214 RepID=UPI000DB70122|nr:fumarylacetoacetate hydrolase family protein [Sphingomonas sp.]PZU09108.1 MAG: fumarylacetoacetate hydrolase [Sphingomonas sp.]